LPEDAAIALQSMTTLNKPGELFGQMEGVKAMTDVTGFGLLGHLSEMCEGSGLSAVIEFTKVPVIASLPGYLSQKCFPGGTQRNWDSYGHKVSLLTDEQRYILADPQTSGGLLVAVSEESREAFEQALRELQLSFNSFGWLKPQDDGPLITVI
jgi:selenide,water dikinase